MCEFHLLWLFFLAVGPRSKAKGTAEEEGGMGAGKASMPAWM